MRDDDGDSLFGSPPSSPVLKALSDTASIHSTLSRPPARSTSVPSGRSDVPAARAGRPSKKAPPPPPKIVTRTFAKPLDFPESTSGSPTTSLLRSHPSLLGTAGNVGGVNASMIRRPGDSSTNPIILDDHSQKELFQPKFVGETTPLRRPIGQHFPQRSVSARELLSDCILKRIASTDVGKIELSSPVLSILKRHPRFIKLIKDLITFMNSIPKASQSASTPADHPPASKRRKTRHGPIPRGAEYWNVPFPFAPEDMPESYHETWRKDNARRLLSEFVEIIQSVQRGLNKENHRHHPSFRPRKVPGAPRHVALESKSVLKSSDSNDGAASVNSACLGVSVVPPPEEPEKDVVDDQIWRNPIDEPTAVASEMDIDDLWRILRDFDSASPGVTDSTDSSYCSSISDSFDLFSTNSPIIGFPLTLDFDSDLSTFGQVGAATYDDTNTTCVTSNSGEDATMEGPCSSSELPSLDFDGFSSYSGMGNEEYGSMTDLTSPTSSFGVLPTPSTASLTATPLDSPKGLFPELDLGFDLSMYPNTTNTMTTVTPDTTATITPAELASLEGPFPSASASGTISLDRTASPRTLPPLAPRASGPVGGKAVALRKQVALANAKVRREELLRELEHEKTRLWEYTIEAGVISNFPAASERPA